MICNCESLQKEERCWLNRASFKCRLLLYFIAPHT